MLSTTLSSSNTMNNCARTVVVHNNVRVQDDTICVPVKRDMLGSNPRAIFRIEREFSLGW